MWSATRVKAPYLRTSRRRTGPESMIGSLATSRTLPVTRRRATFHESFSRNASSAFWTDICQSSSREVNEKSSRADPLRKTIPGRTVY